MNEIEIRNFKTEDYPAIVNIHNSLNIVWPERPRTPEGWAEADKIATLSVSINVGWLSKKGMSLGLALMGRISLNITPKDSVS